MGNNSSNSRGETSASGMDPKRLMQIQKFLIMNLQKARKKLLEYHMIKFEELGDLEKKEILDSLIMSYDDVKASVEKGRPIGIYKNDIFGKFHLLKIRKSSIPIGAKIHTFFMRRKKIYDEEIINAELKSESRSNSSLNVGNENSLIIVKGPLSEVYFFDGSKLHEKFIVNEDKYYTKTTELSVVKINQENYKILKKSNYFKIENGDVRILPSFMIGHPKPTTMKINVGDYIVVEGDNFYRILGEVFDQTYDLLKVQDIQFQGGKKKSAV